MSWVRIDDHCPEHPKLLHAGLAATGLWLRGLAYCSRYLTDGALTVDAVAHMGGTGWPKLAQALVTCGLWDADANGGYRVHDYLDYQPSKEQVVTRRQHTTAKVDEWRKRRGHVGSNPHVTELQGGYQPVCNRAPDPDPDPDPDPQARVPSARPTKPLGYRSRIDVAWPGRPPVPGALHAEFRDKLGGDPADADRRLVAWYPATAAEWADKPIGDDDFRFWKARFREWVGTTERSAKPPTRRPPSAADAYGWCDCDTRCGTRAGHDLKMARASREVQSNAS